MQLRKKLKVEISMCFSITEKYLKRENHKIDIRKQLTFFTTSIDMKTIKMKFAF